MDDFKQDDQDKSPMPPSTRSERIGPTESNSGKKAPKRGLSRLFTKKWFLLVVSTSFLLLIGGSLAIIISAKTYKLDEINKIDISTIIYGKDRKTVVGKIGSENRESVTYDQIVKVNPDLPIAFVKVEDERFFNHHGVDFRGFVRAFVANVLARQYVQGASTITMQVVGNVVLKDRNQKKIWRKLKEVVGAYNLETEASKEKILEVYMNYVDFGNGVHGIKMASLIYFGKDPTKDKLTYEEMALLVGLPKAPYGYNPYGTARQKQRALDRRNVALLLMSKSQPTPALITTEQKKALQKKPLGVNEDFKEKYLRSGDNDAYVDFVKKELIKRYGLSYSDLNAGGYKIYTAMDKKAQASCDRAMKSDALFLNRKGINAGVTMMNSRTGEVIAIGGGRKFAPGSYNWAMMPKQPGSAIKPLTVYGPYCQFKDANKYTEVVDAPFNYHGWKPQNYVRGKFYGNQPLKFVVAQSLNASTAKLLVNEVTVPRSYEFATKELELPLLPQDEVPAALALGGLTEGVSTVNMTQAFTAFPNKGEMTHAHAVLEVVDSDGEAQHPLSGKEIDSNGNPKRVFSEKAAWYTHEMLEGVVVNGTGGSARIGRPVAGKTGTTQMSQEGSFIGYTPDIVCGVCVFNEPGSKDPIAGSGLPAKIFSTIMSEALRGKPVHYFQRPRGVEEPTPPFQLKEPTLSGVFDPTTSSIHLSWGKQDGRVSFEVLRSEDGKSWVSLGAQPSGSTGYTDTSIGVSGFPLPGSKKRYYYQVVAIDSVVGERKTSQTVKVVVESDGNGPPAPPSDGNTGMNPPPGPPTIPANPGIRNNRGH